MKTLYAIVLAVLLIGGTGIADVTLYEETFGGSVGSDYFGGVGNFSYGYDADGGMTDAPGQLKLCG